MAEGLVKRQYPKLIGKTPTQQLKGMDVWPENICAKRNKVCQPRSGGCGFRFKKGDKNWICKKCGQDRRCVSKKVSGGKACRMHGGAKGSGSAPTSMKYTAPQVILDNYNKVLDDSHLLTLSHEIGLLTAYTQQLFGLLDEENVILANQEIREAAREIDDGAHNLNMLKIREGLKKLYSALDPLSITVMAWFQIKDNWKLQTNMAKAQNEWLQQKEEMMPRKHVLEVLIWMNRIGLKYIRDPRDRQAYGREVLALLPKGRDKTK